MANISVIGAGTWGTGIARLLCNNGHSVIMWSPFPAEAESLRKTHIHPNLPNVTLPEELDFTADLEEAMRDKDLIVMAVASPFTRATAEKMAAFAKPGQRIVTVTKGIEETTLLTQVEILAEFMPDCVIGALSGPSHAEEVIIGLPTLIVSASESREMAEYVQNIAAGMADGMGLGDNTKAALITRGIHEMASLAIKMGAHPETLSGLSGIGDLIVTCASMHSRNRRAGILLGQGKSMEEAMREVGQVVEGVYSAKAAIGLAKKYNVTLPITEEVNKVLFENKDPKTALLDLMVRDKKMELSVSGEALPEGWK